MSFKDSDMHVFNLFTDVLMVQSFPLYRQLQIACRENGGYGLVRNYEKHSNQPSSNTNTLWSTMNTRDRPKCHQVLSLTSLEKVGLKTKSIINLSNYCLQIVGKTRV